MSKKEDAKKEYLRLIRQTKRYYDVRMGHAMGHGLLPSEQELETRRTVADEVERLRGINPSYSFERRRGFQPPWYKVMKIKCDECGRETTLRVPRGGFPPGAIRCDCGATLPFGRSRASNPELLIIGNPPTDEGGVACGCAGTRKEASNMRRIRRRRRSRNYPIMVRVGRKRMKYGRALRKLAGRMLRRRKARKIGSATRMAKRSLSRFKMWHGKDRIAIVHRRRRRKGGRRKHAAKIRGRKYIRLGKRRMYWRTLSKKLGPKGAKKIWRAHKKHTSKR
jgi:hypothetical protein